MIFFNLDSKTLIYYIVALVLAITIHEFAHAFVAKLNGDRTAEFAGRLSFNPLRHFDTFGFAMLIFVGFGFAKPVPVNASNFNNRKKGMFFVAVAGVLTNIVLAFISCLIIVLIVANGASSTIMVSIYYFFYYFMYINIMLAVFNILPLYPLDGNRVLETFTRFMNPFVKFLRDYGTYILLMLFCLSIGVNFLTSVNSNFPQWLDLLGTYMSFMSDLIGDAFINFWCFVLGV